MINDEAVEATQRTRTDAMSDNLDVEDKQHERVTRVLKSHFGHSSVESDIEDAALAVLAALGEYLVEDPSAFPRLKENMKLAPEWDD